jgi:hypothetical protein
MEATAVRIYKSDLIEEIGTIINDTDELTKATTAIQRLTATQIRDLAAQARDDGHESRGGIIQEVAVTVAMNAGAEW